MLLFCPTCANILECEEGQNCFRFACSTCPYIYNITRRISSRTYTKLKEVEDVLGGAAAWENVDSTDADCPRCENKRAYFMQIQTRLAHSHRNLSLHNFNCQIVDLLTSP